LNFIGKEYEGFKIQKESQYPTRNRLLWIGRLSQIMTGKGTFNLIIFFETLLHL